MLHELGDQSNTVVIFEYNLYVVNTADGILDSGPDGGGQTIADGQPEQAAKAIESWNFGHLGAVLANDRARYPPPAKAKRAQKSARR